MSKPVTHIIHKLNLEIETPDSKLARKLYQQAGDLLQLYVWPKLEELLKQYGNGDTHIRLDKLDINLNALNGASLEETIKSGLAEAIVKDIEATIKTQVTKEPVTKENVHFSNHSRRIAEAFLWFMEYGTLPWWMDEKNELANSIIIIEAIAGEELVFVSEFRRKLKQHPIVIKRLLNQYDAILLQYLLSLIIPLESFAVASDVEAIYLKMIDAQSDIQEIKRQYWQMVWSAYPVPQLFEISGEVLSTRLKEPIELFFIDRSKKDKPLSDHKTNKSIKDNHEQLEDMNEAFNELKQDDLKLNEANEGLLGSNAGLVLLHPFLQYFFMEFALLNGDTFKNEKAQSTAVHLLHYLATGEEHAPDFNLLFEKYLCGMPWAAITNRYEKLTDKMKVESDVLLQSVIKHWAVLKHTSVAGLRESFLQRKGKLVVKDNTHRIIMERNTLDILLQQISWNISLFKLPWMPDLIHVEWEG